MPRERGDLIADPQPEFGVPYVNKLRQCAGALNVYENRRGYLKMGVSAVGSAVISSLKINDLQISFSEKRG